jgi:hypothetical protein
MTGGAAEFQFFDLDGRGRLLGAPANEAPRVRAKGNNVARPAGA